MAYLVNLNIRGLENSEDTFYKDALYEVLELDLNKNESFELCKDLFKECRSKINDRTLVGQHWNVSVVNTDNYEYMDMSMLNPCRMHDLKFEVTEGFREKLLDQSLADDAYYDMEKIFKSVFYILIDDLINHDSSIFGFYGKTMARCELDTWFIHRYFTNRTDEEVCKNIYDLKEFAKKVVSKYF